MLGGGGGEVGEREGGGKRGEMKGRGEKEGGGRRGRRKGGEDGWRGRGPMFHYFVAVVMYVALLLERLVCCCN